MELWNIAQIEAPSRELCEYPADDLQTIDTFSNFITILTTAADAIGTGHPVWNEIKMFHSLQLKLALKLPCDKFLHIFQRVGHCLQKILVLGLSKLYLDLAEKFLSGLRNASEVVFLPSRQQLEYLLIRTQSTAKLLCETLSYTREAFCYLLQRLRIGHMLQNLLMACSVIARISVMFRALLLQVCNMYKDLKPWCQKLKCGNWKWGQNLDIPDDLWLWLKPDESQFISENILSEHSFLRKIFETVASNRSYDSEVTILPTNDSDDDCNIVENGAIDDNNIPETDIGEVVSRKRKLGVASNQKDENSLVREISRIKCLESLWSIWKLINDSEGIPNLHPLSAAKVKRINNKFCQLHKKISNVNNSKNLTFKEKKSKIAEAVSEVGNEIIKSLTLKKTRRKPKTNFEEEVQVVDVANSNIELKSTKKLIQLKKMFHHMYFMLQSTKQVKLCRQLKKIYKCGVANVRLLKQNNEKELAKKLIVCISKNMIKKYRKQKL